MSRSIPNQKAIKDGAFEYAVDQLPTLETEFNLLELKIRTSIQDAYEAGYKQAWRDKP